MVVLDGAYPHEGFSRLVPFFMILLGLVSCPRVFIITMFDYVSLPDISMGNNVAVKTEFNTLPSHDR